MFRDVRVKSGIPERHYGLCQLTENQNLANTD